MKKLKYVMAFVLMILAAVVLIQKVAVYADDEVQPVTTVGDIDGSGKIDAKDVTLLRRFLAGGWGVTVKDEDGDLDRSGKVDAKDVTILRRFLAGGWGVVLPEKLSEGDVLINEANFPDEHFRDYMSAYVDEDKDGKLSDEELSVEELKLNEREISDLTGIEYFKKLKNLECAKNNLVKLDLSSNTELTQLVCSWNQLTALDLCKNTSLTYVYCFNNKLEQVTFGEDTELYYLDIRNNVSLKEADLKNNYKIRRLYYDNSTAILRNIEINDTVFPDEIFREYVRSNFDQNGNGYLDNTELNSKRDIDISGLDVSSIEGILLFRNLDSLVCSNTKLKSVELDSIKCKRLDVSDNPELTYVGCYNNVGLVSIDVSNSAIVALFLDYNCLTDLDVSSLVNLETLECEGNYITELDLRNNTKLSRLVTDENVSVLRIIEVSEGSFRDSVFREYISLNFDIDHDGYLSEEENALVTEIKLDNLDVRSLDGIEAFKNLELLSCSNTKIEYADLSNIKCKKLDMSNNSELTAIYCTNMGLTEIKLDNSAIERLYVYGNELTELDISSLENLEILYCDFNKLTELDTTKNLKLKHFECYRNNLQILDISKNTDLEYLDCRWNPELEEFDISNNQKLTQFICDKCLMIEETPIDSEVFEDDVFREYVKNKFDTNHDDCLEKDEIKAAQEINVSGMDIYSLKGIEYLKRIESLNFSGTKVTELTVNGSRLKNVNASNAAELTVLNLADNNIGSSLNVAGCTSLKELNIYANNISEVDVSSCVALEKLDFEESYVNNIDLSHNLMLKELYCSYSSISGLDLSANSELQTLYCAGCNLKELDISGNPKLSELNCEENEIRELDIRNNPLLSEDVISCDNLVSITRCHYKDDRTEKYINEFGEFIIDRYNDNGELTKRTSLDYECIFDIWEYEYENGKRTKGTKTGVSENRKEYSEFEYLDDTIVEHIHESNREGYERLVVYDYDWKILKRGSLFEDASVPEYNQVYSYDDQGRLVSIETVTVIYQYTYSSDGRPVLIEQYYKKDGSTENWKIFIYDDIENTIGVISDYYDASYMRYDIGANSVFFSWEDEEEAWDETYLLNEYDLVDNYLLTDTFAQEGDTTVFTYVYDENGSLIDEIRKKVTKE